MIAPPRPRRRWLRRCVVLVLFLAILGYCAPILVAKTGLLNGIIARAMPPYDGTVSVGSATLDWLSPVELRTVAVTDAAGQPLVKVPRVTTAKTLLALLRDTSDLGTITLFDPVVDVICDAQSSNVERAIAKLVPPGPKSNADGTAVRIEIASGTVHLTDTITAKKWSLDAVAATVNVPRSASEPLTVQASLSCGANRLAADVSLGSVGEASVKTDGVPLDIAGPFLRRVEAGTELAGLLTADARVRFTAPSEGRYDLKVEGTLAVADLAVASPRLGAERLAMKSVSLPVHIETVNGIVRITRAALACDLGTVKVSGECDPALPPLAWLERPGLTATAEIDLARIAALLPHLVRVRAGTTIDSGRIDAELTTGPVWAGQVHATSLKATREGRPLAWDQPLTATFRGRLGADRLPLFEVLDAKAEFASISGRGGRDDFTLAADISLDRLAQRLAEFVDLSGIALGGTAKLAIAAKPDGRGGSHAEGTLALNQFAFADGPRGLREPDLNVAFAADGAFNTWPPTRLDSARITANAGTDTLDVKLVDPIPDTRTLTTGKVSAALRGDFAHWRRRAAGFVAIPKEWAIAGNGEIGGTLRFDAARFAADEVAGTLANVVFRGAGLNVEEAQMNIHPTSVVIDRATGRIEIPKLQVATATIGLATEKVLLDPLPGGGYALTVSAAAHVNLARLQRTLQLHSEPLAGIVRGGTVAITAADGRMKFRITVPVEGFSYGDPRAPTWAEPKLSLAAEGEYDPAADTLRFDRAKADRPDGLAVTARGTVGKLSATPDLNLDGTFAYDLATLEPQLKTYFGATAKAAGKESRDFHLAGRLGSDALTASLSGNAGFAWESLRAYGFDVGKADLKAKLDAGTLSIDPLEAAFGQSGKLRLTPTVRFLPGGGELSVAKGLVIDHAKLTPAACADALGFALPVLAKASEAEGTISFIVDESRLPLADPEKGTVKGKLTLHAVAVGPGPVVTELGSLFGAKLTKIALANEQVVPIRFENGRVHHENLALTVNGYTVTTSGSVGVDGSLTMTAQVPVPDSAVGPLLKNNPTIREAIANKRIAVPLNGTVTKPQLDQRAFQTAVRQFVEEVGKDVLKKELLGQGQQKVGEELKKGLEKFLPKK